MNTPEGPTLSPCPFCGGAPYIERRSVTGLWQVGCGSTSCLVRVVTRPTDSPHAARAAWEARP